MLRVLEILIAATFSAETYDEAVSVPVALDRLHAAIAETDRAPYLITVSDDGRPHSVATTFDWQADDLLLPVGNRSLANARARGLVTLLWPPAARSGYTLIVDATVTKTRGNGRDDNVITAQPTHAVLHRPTDEPASSACGADCVPLDG